MFLNMFLLIPIIIAFCSVIGVVIIVYRKIPYLQKLTPETVVVGGFFAELAPELKQTFSSEMLKGYRDAFLLDLEKFLRRTRLMFLKMDAASEGLIKKIRKQQLPAKTSQTVNIISEEAQPELKKQKRGSRNISEADLKKQEQDLIMAIAKNPKDMALYIALGESYMKMGNFDDAKEAFETALKLDEENEKAAGRLDKAMSKIDSA